MQFFHLLSPLRCTGTGSCWVCWQPHSQPGPALGNLAPLAPSGDMAQRQMLHTLLLADTQGRSLPGCLSWRITMGNIVSSAWWPWWYFCGYKECMEYATTTVNSIHLLYITERLVTQVSVFVDVCVWMQLTWRHWAPPQPEPQTGVLFGSASSDCYDNHLQLGSDSRGQRDRRNKVSQYRELWILVPLYIYTIQYKQYDTIQ